jgi:hypothetical protein
MMAGISPMGRRTSPTPRAAGPSGPDGTLRGERYLTLLLMGSGLAVRPLQVAIRLNEQGAVLNPAVMSRLRRTWAANPEQPQRV